MAKTQAIAATGRAILGLLADARPRPEFENAIFELYQIRHFQSPMSEGISLFLYRVAVNGSQRNQLSRPGPHGQRRRRPLPLDLFYMLTPWAGTAEVQHRLLGWAMRTLEDHPILNSGLLNHYAPEPDIFQPDETVEVFPEAISLQEMVHIWEVLKPNQQLSVTYVARMIGIESELTLPDGKPVQTRELGLGQEVIAR
jgi:hypothetical protein